jgi:HSP20 family protein
MAGLLAPRQKGRPARWEGGKSLYDEMEHMLSRLWEEGQEAWFGGRHVPSLDIEETESAIEVKVDLPGLKAEEIQIELSGNMLTVSGHRSAEKEEKGKKVHYVERKFGSFSRTVSLPTAVEEDEVAAEYHEGVLHITLPKPETAKAKKINVKS